MIRIKVESLRIIGFMAVHAPKIISENMQTILNLLEPLLSKPDSNPSILIHILMCFGYLTEVQISIVNFEIIE